MCHNSNLMIKVGMASERGPRHTNDDYCAISYSTDFYAISDGIGGAPRGDAYSKLACNAAIDDFESYGNLDSAFRFANNVASTTSRYLGENSGATLLLASHQGGVIEFAWAGDTIALRLRDDSLEELTEPGRVPGGGNALSKAVAYGPVQPDKATADIRPGDRLVLCTDGVWEYVDDEDFISIVSGSDNAPLIADTLCRHAASVGQDNSTCICLIVEEAPDEDESFQSYAAPQQPSSTPVLE